MNAQIVPSAGNEFAAAQRKEFRVAFLSVAPAMFLGASTRRSLRRRFRLWRALSVDLDMSRGSSQLIY
jgi:hypothetical protein